MSGVKTVKIGIIGGSGLDDPDIMKDRNEVCVSNVYGSPSDVLIEGKISDVECVLLARHGRKHSIMPTNVNYRANIYALKERGCTHVVVTNACGSLKEEIKPGDLVFMDQFIDCTTKRPSTFNDGEESLKGVPMQTPFCSATRQLLIDAAKELDIPHHETGTIVVIEGPRYSSKAESCLYRSWNCDIIGMTTVPEVLLANELGLRYAAVAVASDYDCWREEEASVCVDSVIQATDLLIKAITSIAKADWEGILKENDPNDVNHDGANVPLRAISEKSKLMITKNVAGNTLHETTEKSNLENEIVTCVSCKEAASKELPCHHYSCTSCVNENNLCYTCHIEYDALKCVDI